MESTAVCDNSDRKTTPSPVSRADDAADVADDGNDEGEEAVEPASKVFGGGRSVRMEWSSGCRVRTAEQTALQRSSESRAKNQKHGSATIVAAK